MPNAKNTGLTRTRRVQVTIALAISICVGVFLRLFERSIPEFEYSIASAILVLCICVSVIALVRFAAGWNWVTWTMICAAVLFEVGQVLNITETIAALDSHPILGNSGAYHDTAFRVADFTALTLLLVSMFGVVFELNRAHERLSEKSQSLQREIQGREKAAAELAASETQYRKMVEGVSEIIFQGDLEGRFTFANQRAARILGYSADEIVGRYFVDFVAPEARDEILETSVRQVREGIDHMYMEFPARTKDGATIWLGQNMSLSRSNGKITGVQAVAREITERKEAELALRASEERYRLLVEATGVIPWEADASSFVFTYIGPQAEAILGYPTEAWFRPNFWPETLHPDDRDEAVATCQMQTQRGVDHELSYRMLTAQGDTRWIRDIVTVVSEKGSPTLLRGIFVDITDIREAEEERRGLQTQMQNAQKLESLGLLAGGIAHDFNNLLAGILGNADLALHQAEDIEENLETIISTAKRAGELCQQLLAYSGKGRIVVQPQDLSSVVRDMGELLELPLSKRARIDYALDERLPTIEADVTQIRQVVLNLITNATESFEETTGTIAVRTGVVELDESSIKAAAVHGDLQPGSYVYLEVEDTGCGMDRETQTRIFDPFFTTKFSGRGLGLAAVLGIVRGHHGAIRVRSDLGEGTVIRLYFPASGRPVPVAPPTDTGNGHWRGEGTVLVVDDETVIRNFVTTVLQHMGFEVVNAADGVEAIRKYRKHCDELVAVVLDLTMPNMNGADAHRAMREIREGIPVIVMSGYNEADVARGFAESSVSAFLQKPFKSEQLLATVRDAVAGHGQVQTSGGPPSASRR